MRSTYHFARSGSRTSAPLASARTTAVWARSSASASLRHERAGVAEDVGAVLDDDLAQVDDASNSSPCPVPPAASVPALRSISALPPRVAYRTFRTSRGSNGPVRAGGAGLRSPRRAPRPRHPPAARGRARPARSPPDTSSCSAPATSRYTPPSWSRCAGEVDADRVHPHRPDRRRRAAGRARRGCRSSPTSRWATTTSTSPPPPSSASRCATRPGCSTRPPPTSPSS